MREALEARGSHCLYACGFRIYFTPLPGFFSPFPHGTSSLSVDYEYLALEDGPPIFRQDVTCPALLVVHLVPPATFFIRGYHPLWPDFPFRSDKSLAKEYKAVPISLATTFGISVDVCSSSYLDVSVHSVRLAHLCIQCAIPLRVGFPIRKSPDQSLFASSPKLIAGYHVLRRL